MSTTVTATTPFHAASRLRQARSAFLRGSSLPTVTRRSNVRLASMAAQAAFHDLSAKVHAFILVLCHQSHALGAFTLFYYYVKFWCSATRRAVVRIVDTTCAEIPL